VPDRQPYPWIDLSRWEGELAAAKEGLVALAKHSPLLLKHPMLAAH